MKFDVLGLGNALVDETFYVEKEFLEGTDLFFNQFKSISYENQEAILAKLPSGETPDVMCGGSTTNSLVATSNFGTICGHICQLSDDDRGKLYERNLRDNGIYSLNNFYHHDDKNYSNCKCHCLLNFAHRAFLYHHQKVGRYAHKLFQNLKLPQDY